jgi:hypothetical protein
MVSIQRMAAAGLLGLCVVAATGCGSPSDRLIGKWRIDTQAMADAVGSMGEAAGPLAGMGEAFVKGMMQSIEMECEFQESGAFNTKVNAMGFAQSQTGTWKFVRSEGDKLVVSISAGQGAARETEITFVDDNTIQMGMPAAPEGQPMGAMAQTATFKRVKQ